MKFGTFARKLRTEYNQNLQAEYQRKLNECQAKMDNGEDVHWTEWPFKPNYLTQQLMAEAIGLENRTGYWYLENPDKPGGREFKLEEKEALAKMLGLSIKELENEYLKETVEVLK